MINLVEMLAEDFEECPCKFGNIVSGHACYCHNEDSPHRKCPQWRNAEPYEECLYYKDNNK